MPRGRRLATSSPRGGWPPWDAIVGAAAIGCHCLRWCRRRLRSHYASAGALRRDDLSDLRARVRRRTRDDLASPSGVGREHAMVTDEWIARRRHQRSEPRKQLERRHQSMLRPTAMEVLDPIRDATVTKHPEPLERERRTRPVPAEPLTPPIIFPGNAHAGVDVEAFMLCGHAVRRKRVACPPGDSALSTSWASSHWLGPDRAGRAGQRRGRHARRSSIGSFIEFAATLTPATSPV